ncbi:hypothetical protein PYJP_11830 [Pyrofollis japonicus]|uniref:hypothetical protein n=1 Tax=Pyrofollis japonicus TaxID=3060460 RepID=UPI00295B6C92|nr:hypothetical protein [Pyrofollis japonicus]BEP17831.1 hypothetical protein PYJP_11830 [Pyrofollis japonicus]
MSEARDFLEKLVEPVEVDVEVVPLSPFSEEGYEYVKRRLGVYEKVVLKRLELDKWGEQLPEPAIRVGGRLQGRLVYYGIPADVLLMPFYLSIALAGGAWEGEKPSRCPSGRLALYVVSGLPCTRALYYSIQVVAHCPDTELWSVNAEAAIVQGYGIPSSRVPAFITTRGKVIVKEPKSVDEAASIWDK